MKKINILTLSFLFVTILGSGLFASSDSVMLQGFNWESHDCNWYNTLQSKATDLSNCGINMVWFPQPASSSGGMGYLIQKYYDLNNAVGSRSQLDSAIAAMHAQGIKVLADIVINHRVGVWDWADFQDPAWGSWAVCSDDEWGQGTGNSDSGAGYEAARDLDHSNQTVQNDIKAWLNWLKNDVGFDGWRYDYAKGYWGGYNKIYNEASTPWFSVGEYWPDIPGDKYWDAAPNIEWHRQLLSDWINAAGNTSTAFDFTTKWQLQLALEQNELWRLGSVPGLIGTRPDKAVTFLDNHDTGSTQNHWPFPGDKVLQGYAYILTHPGIPCIFWDHFYDWGHHDAIKALIQIRKQKRITSTSSVDVQKAEGNCYAAVIDGVVAMKIGSGSWTPGSGEWTLAASGTDYAVWTTGGVVDPVTFNPDPALPGQALTVTYKGSLKDSTSLTLHWGYDNWQSSTQSAMTKQGDGSWQATVSVPTNAGSRVVCYFKDQSGTTDNNSGADYSVNVSGGGDQVTIHYKTAWTTVNVHYNNGSGWTTPPGAAMAAEGEGWYQKTVTRSGASITCCFNNGSSWDNNGDQNYTSALNEFWVMDSVIYDHKPVPVQPVVFEPAEPYIGQQVTITYNGSLKGASQVTIHWGYDGWNGVTDTDMSKQADGSWKVTLTVPTAATSKLDCVFKDNANNWDNNGGNDYGANLQPWNENQPPTVSLTSPAAAAVLSGNVMVSATASDDVAVAKVEFYLGSSKVGEKTSAPWSITLDTGAFDNGAAMIKARAYDGPGLSAEDTVNVTIDNDNTPPVVSFTIAEDPNQIADQLSASITASDNKGVDRVELSIDGNLKGSDTTSPYAITVDTSDLAPGSHTVAVRAVDTSGNSSTNSMTITKTTGTYTQKVHYYSTVPARNVFVQYKQLAGYCAYPGEKMSTEKPNWFFWQKTLPSAPLQLRFLFSGGRWDNNGGSDYTAGAAEIWIKNGTVYTSDPEAGEDNENPTVSLTSPGNGSSVSGQVQCNASADDNVGVVRVEFHLDGSLVHNDSVAPYSYSWQTGVPDNGTHTLVAKAYDAAGNEGTDSVSFTVTNQQQTDTPPTVGSLTPGANPASGTVSITATASDDKGVARVEFYLGGSKVGEATSAPWAISLLTTGYTNGSYTLQAVAYDTINQSGDRTCSLTIQNSQQTNTGKPYSTNPTLGKAVAPGSITIDGANNGEWSDDMLIALDMANDDPRSLGSNWSMHETPWDLTHLWAAWDDQYLYIAWQYVDVTDMIDPANAGSSAGTKVNQMDLIQWLAIDTTPGAGSATDMWGKNYGEPYWTGSDLPDYQIYLASNLWQGYIAPAVGGSFSLEPSDGYKSVADANIETAVANGLAASTLWGVRDADHALENPIDYATKVVDFKAEGHDGGRDTFYEMKIPLAALGIDRKYLENNGIGIMLGQGEGSCMDTIPNDPATSDTPGTTDSNSPKEWEDIDSLTSPFARIGHTK